MKLENIYSKLQSSFILLQFVRLSILRWTTIGNKAHTKQTPRNPNLERQSAAMGSDVQERRAPSKPTTKKIATKEGKQPCKHMLHKLL